MGTDKKLYVALGVLALLVGLFFLQSKKEKQEAATYSLTGQKAQLPKIEVSEDDTKKIDKITINKPGEDGGAPLEVELTKSGEDWKVTRPIEAFANQANVKSLLDNLKTLKVNETIDSSAAAYDKYNVSDSKGLHVVAKKGDAVALDAYFGEGGGRGQMTRIAGKQGVYAVKGYSSYLYSRDLKGWRDMTIFKFEDTAVTNVSVENENGSFSFAKEGEKWTGKHKPKKGGEAGAIKNFDESKVGDLVRAFKALSGDNFAEKGKAESDVGLDKPAATLVFTLKDGAKRDLKIGNKAEGSSRWVKASGSDEIWSVSSWAADWATADAKKFQKPDEKDKDKAKGDAPPSGMPGMPGMPGGMPPGMPPGMPEGAEMGEDPHGH